MNFRRRPAINMPKEHQFQIDQGRINAGFLVVCLRVAYSSWQGGVNRYYRWNVLLKYGLCMKPPTCGRSAVWLHVLASRRGVEEALLDCWSDCELIRHPSIEGAKAPIEFTRIVSEGHPGMCNACGMVKCGASPASTQRSVIRRFAGFRSRRRFDATS